MFDKETQDHIDAVVKLVGEFIIDLCGRGVNHDRSKFSKEEASLFKKMTPKLKEVEYDSKEYKEMLAELKPALDHHYAVNSHHPEHYKGGFKDMNLVDIMELLADWKASTSRGKNGSILTSIEKNQSRFGYSDDVKSILVSTVEYMGWE